MLKYFNSIIMLVSRVCLKVSNVSLTYWREDLVSGFLVHSVSTVCLFCSTPLLSSLSTNYLLSLLFQCLPHSSCVLFCDSNLVFDSQVFNVAQSCFLQLRLIAKIKSFLSTTNLDCDSHVYLISFGLLHFFVLSSEPEDNFLSPINSGSGLD